MYCVSCAAASFTLTGSYDVSTIDVVLFTPAPTSFTTFDFSLLTSATISIASQAVTAPLGAVSTGYFGTTITPGNVDGWMMSTGVYDEAAGTVANGEGSFVGTTWDLSNSPGEFAPAFSVNGSLAAATPEPSAIFLMLGGLAALRGLVARRKIIRRPGSSGIMP
jgi:hypothetical protein